MCIIIRRETRKLRIVYVYYYLERTIHDTLNTKNPQMFIYGGGYGLNGLDEYGVYYHNGGSWIGDRLGKDHAPKNRLY